MTKFRESKKGSWGLGVLLLLVLGCNNAPQTSANTTTTTTTPSVVEEPITVSKVEQVLHNYQQQMEALCKNGDFFMNNLAEFTELIQLEQQALTTAPPDKHSNIEARIEKYQQSLEKQKNELQQTYKELIDNLLDISPYQVPSGEKQHPSIKKRVATDIQTQCPTVFVQLNLGKLLE